MDLARWSQNYWEVCKQGKKRFFPFSVHLHVLLGGKMMGLCRVAGSHDRGHRRVRFGAGRWCVSLEAHQLWTAWRKSGNGPISVALSEHITKPPHRSQSAILLKPKSNCVIPRLQGSHGPSSLKESKMYTPTYRILPIWSPFPLWPHFLHSPPYHSIPDTQASWNSPGMLLPPDPCTHYLSVDSTTFQISTWLPSFLLGFGKLSPSGWGWHWPSHVKWDPLAHSNPHSSYPTISLSYLLTYHIISLVIMFIVKSLPPPPPTRI